MAVKVSDEIRFGAGNRGFRLVNRDDQTDDRKQYQNGRVLEHAHFEQGSFGQRIFERLSNKPKQQEEAHQKKVSKKKQKAA